MYVCVRVNILTVRVHVQHVCVHMYSLGVYGVFIINTQQQHRQDWHIFCCVGLGIIKMHMCISLGECVCVGIYPFSCVYVCVRIAAGPKDMPTFPTLCIDLPRPGLIVVSPRVFAGSLEMHETCLRGLHA